MPTNIMGIENIWDRCRDFPSRDLINLANKIGPQKPKPITEMEDAIKEIQYICFVAKCMISIEKDHPDLKNFDHTDIAIAVDGYITRHDLASHWKQGLFEPCCAAVRTLRKNQVPWYRQQHYRWNQQRGK